MFWDAALLCSAFAQFIICCCFSFLFVYKPFLSLLTIPPFQRYMDDHNAEDYLLTGFHGKNQNPFREKSSCSVLWATLGWWEERQKKPFIVFHRKGEAQIQSSPSSCANRNSYSFIRRPIGTQLCLRTMYFIRLLLPCFHVVSAKTKQVIIMSPESLQLTSTFSTQLSSS